jgi:hypothetical protein
VFFTQSDGRRSSDGLNRFGTRLLSETKIENLCLATLGHKYISWLDVAMDNAFAVGSIEGISNLDGKL